MVWFLVSVALSAESGEDVLGRCGHDDLTLEGLDDKQRRKALFDRASVDAAQERFLCAAELTKLVQTSTNPRRPASVRKLDEMVVASAELAYARQGLPAMNEGDFDIAEAVFRRLAAIGHVRSLQTMRGWATLDRRAWLYSRARDALASRRPRLAVRLLTQLADAWDDATIATSISWKAVVALRERADAAVTDDEALAAKEAADGVSCWTTLAGPPDAIRVVGECPEGTSERLRTLHDDRVSENRARYTKGPVHVTTEHPGG